MSISSFIAFSKFLFLSLIIFSFLSACQTEPVPDEPIPPTGEEAFIAASDQNIEFATVIVNEVVIPVDGWIVIHTDDNSTPGEVVGVEALGAGQYTDIAVGIDTDIATDTLHAMLHVDSGQIGVFEYPGPDEPLTSLGEPVITSFKVGLLPPEEPVSPIEPEVPVLVRITDNSFEPEDLTITPGTIIVWVNEGSGSHTVTSDEMFFDSGVLETGMDFEFTFRDSGEYSYHCQIHGEVMSGTITVVQP